MSFDLDKESLIYPTISHLRLIDRRVGRNEETVNFDSKHIVKRVHTCLIGNNFKIGEGKIMLSSDIAKVLTLAPNNSRNSTEQLCNPKDKQNVPLQRSYYFSSVKLYKMLISLKH